MSSLPFARYLSLLPDVTSDVVDETWRALRKILVYEMKKRDLWVKPPSFLGISGMQSWAEDLSSSSSTTSALDELTAECFSFIFVQRAIGLIHQLERKSNIDGLVFLNVRHFLTGRQRAQDPLGYRLFSVLRAAVKEKIAAGEWHLIDGDKAVKNNTIIASHEGANPRRLCAYDDLRDVTYSWCDSLLPGMITAQGPGLRAVQGVLRDHLGDIDEIPPSAFSFGDLVDALKFEVRERWLAIFSYKDAAESAVDSDGQYVTTVRVFKPEFDFEEVQFLDRLRSSVSNQLDCGQFTKPTARHLHSLWEYLVAYAIDAEAGSLPSWRQMSLELDIPRNRMKELHEILSGLVARSRQALLQGASGQRRSTTL